MIFLAYLMEKNILILTVGIPGAGKTTWVQSQVKRQPGWVISTDELRKELLGDVACVSHEQNEWIHQEAFKRAKKIFQRPVREPTTIVYIDATNITIDGWVKFKTLRPTIMIAKYFDISPEMAMIRQSMRDRRVSYDVIKAKWDEMQKNKKLMSHIFDLIV